MFVNFKILKVWSSLSPKIISSSKSAELKKCIAQIPAAPPKCTNAPPKIFQRENLLIILSFLESLHRKLSEKLYMSPTDNLKLQSYSTKSILTLPIFSKFQLCTVQDFLRKTALVVKNRSFENPKTNRWNRMSFI
jgi:hypothetical protein